MAVTSKSGEQSDVSDDVVQARVALTLKSAALKSQCDMVKAIRTEESCPIITGLKKKNQRILIKECWDGSAHSPHVAWCASCFLCHLRMSYVGRERDLSGTCVFSYCVQCSNVREYFALLIRRKRQRKRP